MTKPLLLAALVGALGCQKPAAPAPAPAPPKPALPPEQVAATVNGHAVSRFEVLLRQRTMQDAEPREALEALIDDELRAQRAAALGLEREPAFLEEMARVEAQVSEVRRRELARLLLHREVLDQARVSDEEVQRAFEQRRARFGAEVRVVQLSRRDRGAVEAALAEVQRGRDFADVAAGLLGVTREALVAGRPLRWDEVPPAWWPALEGLQPGEVSGVIAAPGGRFVALQLLERRPVAAPDFDAVKPLLAATLRSERIEALRARADADLRVGATIVSGPADPRIR